MAKPTTPSNIHIGPGLGAIKSPIRFALSPFLTYAPNVTNSARIIIQHPQKHNDASFFSVAAAQRLIDRGVKIRVHSALHAKVYVTEADELYVGSGNLTGAGLGLALGQPSANRNIEAMVGPLVLDANTIRALEQLWVGSEELNITTMSPQPPNDVFLIMLSMPSDFGTFQIPKDWHNYDAYAGDRLRPGTRTQPILNPTAPEAKVLERANRRLMAELARCSLVHEIPGPVGRGLLAVREPAWQFVKELLTMANGHAKLFRKRALTKEHQRDFVKRVTAEWQNLGAILPQTVSKDHVQSQAVERFHRAASSEPTFQWQTLAVRPPIARSIQLAVARANQAPTAMFFEQMVSGFSDSYARDLTTKSDQQTNEAIQREPVATTTPGLRSDDSTT